MMPLPLAERDLAERDSSWFGRGRALRLALLLLLLVTSPRALLAQTPASADAGTPAVPAAPPASSAEVQVATPSAPAAPDDQVPASTEGATATSADTDAAFAELVANTPAIEADAPNLQIYGFADFGIRRLYAEGFLKDSNSSSPFYIGNVNVYLAANLTHGFSSLAEVRFTFMPGGSTDAAGEYITTYATDPANFNRAERWGGIVMQRVHLDYSYHSLLNLRIGQFLTPYGIWNVDHGSPTIIGISKPYAIGDQLFPERQIGLQVFGTYLVKNATLGYHLTLSNGRGDFENMDFDKNKALGGRLFVSTDVIGSFKFGISGYGGRATYDASSAFIFTNGQPSFTAATTNQYDELALAADVLWEWKGLRVQAEALVTQTRYTERGRRARVDAFTGAANGFVPDHVKWAWYGLIGYRLPWYPIMPFVMVEEIRAPYGSQPPGNLNVGTGSDAFNVGLNIRPIPSVAFKGQYIRVLGRAAEDIHIVGGQVAWAF